MEPEKVRPISREFPRWRKLTPVVIDKQKVPQVLPSDLFGCFKWPFQGLSDLHLGDQKVTWKKLAVFVSKGFSLRYYAWGRFKEKERNAGLTNSMREP